MVREEEEFNLQNHFERYFSISGFLRNLLNEIIKLQASQETSSVSNAPAMSRHVNITTSSCMIIKVLDTLSYFMTQRNGQGL